MKNFALLFYFTLFLAQAAIAEVADTRIQQVMTEAGFNEQQVSQVQSLIETAPQKGLQPEAITSKVYEGIAKRVAPDRIVQALERVTSRFEYGHKLANELVQGKTQVRKLGTTVASGVAAGLTHQDVEKIKASLLSKSATLSQNDFYALTEETMRTARDLSRQGVSSTTTAEVIGYAVKRGFDAKEMQTMRGSFNKQGVHENVESLARSYGNAIEQGVRAQELANRSKNSRRTGGSGGHGSGGGPGGSGGSGNGGGRR